MELIRSSRVKLGFTKSGINIRLISSNLDLKNANAYANILCEAYCVLRRTQNGRNYEANTVRIVAERK